MDTENTRRIIADWFDAIAKDDVDAILGALAPGVVCELPGNEWSAVIPNLGTHVGKEAVAEAFRLRSEHMEALVYRPILGVLAEGNVGYAVVYTKLMHRRTRVVWEHEMAHRLVLDDAGQISHWHVYFDSSGEVAAFSADLGEQLMAAVQDGDDDRVRTLLEHGANPSFRDASTGLTALHMAAGRGDTVVVRLLLEAGADVFTVDSRGGATPLHKAVQGGNLDTVRLLVDAGAFIDAPTSTTGHTPLTEAFWYKWPDIVGYLLDRNASLNLVTHYGFSMREHVDYALGVNQIGGDSLRAADELWQARADADARAVDGHALMAAVVGDNMQWARDLLAAGADVDARFPVVNGFNDSHTPLLVAARDGHTEMVSMLLAAGANVNSTEPTFGATALHKAVYNGHADITGILVRVPGVDLDYQGITNGYTALHDALWHGFGDCARILLAADARVDLMGHDGQTPYTLAVRNFGSDHDLTAAIRAAQPR
jgi:ankyrin repeat protein